MTDSNQALDFPSTQPDDIRGLSTTDREKLIIRAVHVEGHWVTLSKYADDVWLLSGLPTNTNINKRRIDFSKLPQKFKPVMKAIIYRYIMRGRNGGGRPKGSVIFATFHNCIPFLNHLLSMKIDKFSEVTPMVCATYVAACKDYRCTINRIGQPLSPRGLQSRYSAVEAIHELSQYTDDAMQQLPWAETSAKTMAGLTGAVLYNAKTPLMPDDVFCVLFGSAYQKMENGQYLLDLRDAMYAIDAQPTRLKRQSIANKKAQELKNLGWSEGLRSLQAALTDLRTSCYIVLACVSGCRNHELSNLHTGAHHRTEDDTGITYHWMRSRSEKTDAGIHYWMIPESGVRALRLMERWAAPYQAKIAKELQQRRRANPQDPEIVEAKKHQNAIFLFSSKAVKNSTRTMTNNAWDRRIKEFATSCGLTWKVTSHQFRRKFANYVAHSKFGDLRYLKEHFAHWSLDMTMKYAMDETWGAHLDIDLYDEIQSELGTIKIDVVNTWLDDTPLAGGYGQAIKHWQRDPKNLLIFKDRTAMLKSIAESTAIRSNGHAWCTADKGNCIGNNMERTRCGGCENSVISLKHAKIYERLLSDLDELRNSVDIGEAGRKRVDRDLTRCREILTQLGAGVSKVERQ
ncbi:tyrosine-type recombinase/integrase [Pseudomonas putida]|uniref:Tyrosine-type recombinase/integrase n=1 Tax=Pseudomonas putida TaxID=303 RepID=A0A6I6Y696_PSEPU|nr:tyrosine-type recombinase/integrase [Pseudomonas putida]QHG67137.1 tyrosine-type recombinase/integrase [Pseudomonas putida]